MKFLFRRRSFESSIRLVLLPNWNRNFEHSFGNGFVTRVRSKRNTWSCSSVGVFLRTWQITNIAFGRFYSTHSYRKCDHLYAYIDDIVACTLHRGWLGAIWSLGHQSLKWHAQRPLISRITMYRTRSHSLTTVHNEYHAVVHNEMRTEEHGIYTRWP